MNTKSSTRYSLIIKKIFIATLLLFISSNDISSAGKNPDFTKDKLSKTIVTVTARGNYAFTGVGEQLIILNISNLASLAEVGSIVISGGQVEDIYITECKAYVAAGDAGMRIMDITKSTNPREICSIRTQGYAKSVVVVNQYAYIADGGALCVVDVSDPNKLKEIGSVCLPGYTFDVDVIDNYAYVASAGAGLRIVNISNPINPVEVGGYDTPGYAYGLFVFGSTAYIADGWEGLRVIDIANPRRPREIGFYKTPGWAFDVVVKGNTAYVADAFAGVRMIDISNPNHPVEIGAYEKLVDIHKISVIGNTIYAADRRGGVRVIQASNSNLLIEQGFYKLGNVPEVHTSSSAFNAPALKQHVRSSPRLREADQFRLRPKLPPKGGAEKADIHFNMIGQIGGATQAIAVVGNYAYVAVGLRMEILDVSNPADLRQVGATVPFPYFVEGVAVSGTLAYLAVGEAGLRVVDISNPTHPVEVGAWDSPGYAEGIAVEGNIVYLADGPYGLFTVDVSDPAHPRKIGTAYDMNYAYGVALSGSYAFIAAARAGLLVVDISDPVHTVELGVMDTPGNTLGIAISGTIAYLADDWGGLQVVDITVPGQPVGISSYKTPGSAVGVFISGTRVYVADAFKGLRVLDVSDITHPKELSGFESTYGNAVSINVVDSIAYLADRNWGLRSINVSDPDHLVELNSYKSMAYVEAVDVAGNYAYVVSSGIGLRVVDVSDPAHPKWLGATDIVNPDGWRDIFAMSVLGSYAYVGIGGRLVVVDISDPNHPFWTESIELKGIVRDLTIANGIAYIADEGGLQLADLSDPTHPSLLGRIVLSTGQGAVSGVAVSGSLVYVTAESDGFHIIDVSNPNNPIRIGGSTKFDYPYDVFAIGNWAYVLDQAGLYIVDVSNPNEPQVASFLYIGDIRRVLVSGSNAYIASGRGGLFVADVSDPFHPIELSNFKTQGYSLEVKLYNNRVFLADGQNGLVILEQVPSVEKINTIGNNSNKISVTSPADDGPGTFRQCLMNAVSGDTIVFDPTVFPPTNPVTIKLNSVLPTITQGNITIDGSNAGVVLDGSALTGETWYGPSGLHIVSNGNTVMGLQIYSFPNHGVEISGDENMVGGDRSRGDGPVGQGNVSSGNGAMGVHAKGHNNIVVGNLLGTDVTGTQDFGNSYNAVALGGSGHIIGRADPRYRNILVNGIQMGPGTSGNFVEGNYIGTDITGTISLGNSDFWGISMEDGAFNNVVSKNLCGNRLFGIALIGWGSDYNSIIGNFIGTDVSGTKPLPNVNGVVVGIFASFNRIGGTESGEENLISGNSNTGVSINNGAQGNIVLGNIIGTTIDGNSALGNSQGVLLLTSNVGTIVENNLVSGNNSNGIGVEGDNNFVIGNHIGTDISFTGSVPNKAMGIYIRGEHNFLQGNLVANNLVAGIQIDQGSCNTIRRNVIYSNAGKGISLANGGNGMLQAPKITSVTTSSVSGTAQPNCTIEIFSDLQNQGNIFEGTTFSDSMGVFTFTKTEGLTGPNVTETATDIDGNTSEFSDGIPVGIEENQFIPYTYSLFQNYPNPFNPITSISFSLPAQSFVTLTMYDAIGRRVSTLISEELPAGRYARQWNAASMSSGVYFYRLQAGSFTDTKKLILLR